MMGTSSSHVCRSRSSLRFVLFCLLIATLLVGACTGPVGATAAGAPAALLAETNGAPAPLPPRPGGAFPTTTAVEVAPVAPVDEGSSTVGQSDAFAPIVQATSVALPTPTPEAALLSTERPGDWLVSGPARVALSSALPAALADSLRAAIEDTGPLQSANGTESLSLTSPASDATLRVDLAGAADPGEALATRYFAAVVPFDTVQDDITLDELTARWDGSAPVYAAQEALDWLPAILGQPGTSTEAVDAQALIGLLEENRDAIALIPFEQIDPRFKVLTVDGINVLSNQLQVDAYPLVVQAKLSGEGASQLYARLAAVAAPTTNRDPSKLTSLVMTGVTAIARGTAAAIERAGDPAYPALVIGPELALADITHVSNEIPFIEGCVVNNTENNLQLCSDPSYWAALELMGTDIVGLSGNHVNDFGRDGARESLGWYKENKIPVYGSGLTVDSACAPLLWENNGNTFAFIAALAYGPESAWVTDEEPGACYYYEHKERILSTIETLSKAVDIVAVELQYEETYFAYPTPTQVEEFRELRAAGADLVTGVQSHVPQAQEPYGAFDDGGDGFISYGLGNLYFDQMWSWETRTELYARHAIYDGKLINTEILTGVLEDYAQPRWTTPAERAELLQTIFDGAPDRP